MCNCFSKAWVAVSHFILPCSNKQKGYSLKPFHRTAVAEPNAETPTKVKSEVQLEEVTEAQPEEAPVEVDEATPATPPVTPPEVTQTKGDTSEEADPVATGAAQAEKKTESPEATAVAEQQPAEPVSPLSAAAPSPPKGESVSRSLSVSGKSLPVPKKYTKK